jgi:hypothetical protein
MRVDELFAFIRERHAIYERRAAGLPKPWTEDPILQRYRFTQVYRELDAVTVWIRENWREPHADDPDLWFAMVVARHLNLPASLEELGYPVPWNRDHFVATCATRKARGDKNFNGAYMIGTSGSTIEKAVYIADRIFTPMWERRDMLRPRLGDTLNSYHTVLGQLYGLASFLAAQVIADLRHHEPLCRATDLHTFAASGPGSRRGLNRVLGRDKNTPWKEEDWRLTLARLHSAIEPLVKDAGMPVIYAQDLQSVLCEADKYWRCKDDGGRPKQLYPGV